MCWQDFRESHHDADSPFPSKGQAEKEESVLTVEIDNLEFAPPRIKLLFFVYAYSVKLLLVLMVPFIYGSPSIVMMGYLGFVLFFLG